MKNLGIYWAAVIMAAMLGCSKEAGQSGGPEGNGGMAAVQKPVPVAVAPVEVGEASSFYITTANLEPEFQASVMSRTTGVVLALLVEEGDRVEADQVLLRLEDIDQKLALKQARLTLAQRQREHTRRVNMRESGILSQQEFDESKNALEQAQAQVEVAEVSLAHTEVRAPIAGRIVRRHKDPGAQVQPGVALFDIMDVAPLLARVHVPANRMGSVALGQILELTLDSNGAPLRGVVNLISPIVDADTGTVKVTAEIHNYPPGTRPGDFAEVRLRTDNRARAMLVPSVAVFEDRGEQVVYVAMANKAERRPVVLGFVDGNQTEIVQGIRSEEWIVVKGQRHLRDGSPIEILEGPPEALTLSPAEAGGEAAL